MFDATAGRGADEDEDAEEEREEERRRAGGRGGSAEPDGEAEGEEAGAGPGSRVVKLGGAGGRGGVAAAPASDFVRQLRRAARRAAAAEPGSEAALSAWGPVLGVLRGMSATAIDRELRAIQVWACVRIEGVGGRGWVMTGAAYERGCRRCGACACGQSS